ncbi:uncharacterized protein [Physcomitrium patens]|uniref:uncharacterized protein isoform X3 n=1 Tax=Physcomitrium patens TaxID=3218 RepID=UPI003CCD1D6A
MLWQWIDSLRAFISRTCGASRGSAVGLELIVVVDNGELIWSGGSKPTIRKLVFSAVPRARAYAVINKVVSSLYLVDC